MATQFCYLYLHGFRGDVQTTKGAIFRKRFAEKGIELNVFDVKAGKGHADTRVSISLQALEAFYHEHKKPLRLIGSSMGGFISAVYASQHPTHVDRVILLNPAVNLKVAGNRHTSLQSYACCVRSKHGRLLRMSIMRRQLKNGKPRANASMWRERRKNS